MLANACEQMLGGQTQHSAKEHPRQHVEIRHILSSQKRGEKFQFHALDILQTGPAPFQK